MKTARDNAEKIKEISGANPQKCMKCGKCSATCPAFNEMDIKPHQFVSYVAEENIDALMQSETLWKCLSCFACVERCPRDVKPGKLIDAARQMVVRQRGADYLKAEEIPGGEKVQRIGVFVCHCGSNIAATVDVKKVVEMAKLEPGVVHAEDYQYMCSEAGQAKISYGRVSVVLSCTFQCSLFARVLLLFRAYSPSCQRPLPLQLPAPLFKSPFAFGNCPLLLSV